MTAPDCLAFLEDPEAHATHRSSCNRCDAMSEALSGEDLWESIPHLTNRLAPQRLPVAEWEGANLRSWGFVFAVALAIVAVTTAGFLLAGISPVEGITRSIQQTTVPQPLPLGLVHHLGRSLHAAPASFHLTLALSFLFVNLVLILLLKRPPRGIHAPGE